MPDHTPDGERPSSPAPGPPPPPPVDARRGEVASTPGPPPPPAHALRPRRPARPSVADAIVLPIWVLAGQLIGGLLILPMMVVQGFETGLSEQGMIAITVVLGWTVVVLGLWLWLRYRRAWRPDWLTGHAPWSGWKASAAGVAGAVVGFIVMQVFVITVSLLTGTEPPEQEIFDLLDDPMLAWVIGATAVLAAPVIEEVVFRGVVLDVFRRRWGWWPSALAQAAIFSAIHIETLASPTMFLSLAMLGFLFALLRRLTGSLVAPVVAHLVFNLVSLGLTLALGG